jgi:hypothetical protein
MTHVYSIVKYHHHGADRRLSQTVGPLILTWACLTENMAMMMILGRGVIWCHRSWMMAMVEPERA